MKAWTNMAASLFTVQAAVNRQKQDGRWSPWRRHVSVFLCVASRITDGRTLAGFVAWSSATWRKRTKGWLIWLSIDLLTVFSQWSVAAEASWLGLSAQVHVNSCNYQLVQLLIDVFRYPVNLLIFLFWRHQFMMAGWESSSVALTWVSMEAWNSQRSNIWLRL